MMKGFVRELQKTIFRLPCLLVIFFALIVNGCLLYTQASGEMISSQSYKKANTYIAELPETEQMAFLKQYKEALENGEQSENLLFAEDAVTEHMLIREFEKRVSQIEGYTDYLEGIQEKAKKQSISIFQNTSDYTKKEIRACADAFLPLTGTTLTFVNSDTFVSATEFAVTDIIVLAVLFYLVSSMVIYEKEHGLFALLRSTKEGRGSLLSSKMLVGMTGAAFLVLLFWAENLLLSVWKYGVLDFSAPLQSVYQYETAAVRMNIGQFLVLFWATKAAVYMLLSMIILFLSLKAKNTMTVYLGAVMVFGISLICYAVGAYSGFHFLHYCNLIYWVQTVTAYRFYFHLNFFGYPVSITVFFWCCVLVCSVLFGVLNWKLFTGKKFYAGMKRGWTWKKRGRKRVNVSVCSHEMYKLLISSQGLLLIGFCIAVQVWTYGQKDTRLSMDEYYYKQYMKVMAGEMNEEKEAFLVEEQESFREHELLLQNAARDYEEKKISEPEMNAISRLVSEKMESRAAFERVLQRAEYARQFQVPMVYETGYLELAGFGMNGYQDDIFEAAFFVTAMILLTVPYFAGEYSQGMMKLIGTQYFGRRKTLAAKGKAIAFAVIPIAVIVYLPRILQMGKLYGYVGIRESISAIPELADSFYQGSILGYLVFIYLLRMFAAGVTITFIIAAAINRKNIAQAVSTLFILLVFPLVLHLIGISIADYCSLNAVYSVNMLLNRGGTVAFMFGVCMLGVLLAGSVYYIMETIGKERWDR